MISAPKLCLTCGSEIPADAREGGSPGCLLETALDAIDGQVVFGWYKLVKVLGRRRKGIVWVARDEELERMITEGLGDLDKSGIAELTSKGRHKAGRESRQPIGYRAAVRSKIALPQSGLTNLVT